jgi:uncharacterized membrane protein YeaQ/YmgE (transglycosylase-associated protein family)
VGILAANVTGLLAKKYSFGFTGNTIVGVFGSIFLIKTFGRLGFNPQTILADGFVNYSLLMLNLCVSICGGVFAVLIGFKLKTFFDKKRDPKN